MIKTRSLITYMYRRQSSDIIRQHHLATRSSTSEYLLSAISANANSKADYFISVINSDISTNSLKNTYEISKLGFGDTYVEIDDDFITSTSAIISDNRDSIKQLYQSILQQRIEKVIAKFKLHISDSVENLQTVYIYSISIDANSVIKM